MKRPLIAMLATCLIAANALAGAPLKVVSLHAPPNTTGRIDATAEVVAAAREALGAAPDVTPLSSLPPSPVASTETIVFCASGWSLEALRGIGLTPILLGVRGGATGDQTVLLAKAGTSVAALKGRRLATRPLSAEARTGLETSMFQPAGLSLKEMTVVEVSKGVDAVLAVRNGQVEASLVDRADLEKAAKVVPPILTGVVELLTSPELPYAAVLVATALVNDPAVVKVTGALTARPATEGGIERWVPAK